MDVYYFYSYGTAGWLTLQAAPLLISPQLVVSMLARDMTTVTQLETYFSRALGCSLISLGILTLLLTGSVPLTSRMGSDLSASTDPENPTAPYAQPTLTVTMLYHVAMAFACYVEYFRIGSIGFILGTVGSGMLGAIAMWCLLFATSEGHISRRTGADKRTSGYPFKNAEAAKKKGKKSL